MGMHDEWLSNDGVLAAAVRHADRTASLGFFVFDTATERLWLSERAARLLGGATTPTDAPAFIARVCREDASTFEAVLRGDGSSEGSCEFRCAEGSDDCATLYLTVAPSDAPTAPSSLRVGTLCEATSGPFVTEALHKVVAGTGARYGADFFAALVVNLASACGTKYAYLAEFVGPRRRRVRTFALCVDGEIRPDFEYDLANTPCDNVASATVCLHPRNVQSLYPQDQLLVDMGIEGYLGVPLFASSGEPMGILIVLHDKPLRRGQDLRTILSIFAARAAAERERMHAEAARAELESRARQSQKLESLGMLAGTIAHDFNNYLGAMMGNAELVSIAIEKGKSPAPYVDGMLAGIRQASELARQILAYSGRGTQAVGPVQLNQLIAEMTALLRVSLQKQIVLATDLDASLPPLRADGGQLQQVVLNLVTNAADAIGKRDGTIRVRTSRATLGPSELQTMLVAPAHGPGEYARIEVADDGSGMSPETLERIFEPYFSTKSQDRGFGLASMLGIVKGHAGALDVDSTLGRGTTFRLYFPIVA